MILYKNTKAMVRTTDSNTDFFGIAAETLQGETLVPYMLIICQDYIFQMSIDLIKENGLTVRRQ